MKKTVKLISLLLSAVMLITLSAFTASAEDNAVVYDLLSDFENKDLSKWSIGLVKADGTDAYTHKFWINGTSDPNTGEPADAYSYGQTWLGGAPLTRVTAGDNTGKLIWTATEGETMSIRFKATSAGAYAVKLVTNRAWGVDTRPETTEAEGRQRTGSAYMILVNGETVQTSGTVTTKDDVTVEASVVLNYGDVITLAIDGVDGNATADTSYISECKITYSAVPAGYELKETYDLFDAFESKNAGPFVAGLLKADGSYEYQAQHWFDLAEENKTANGLTHEYGTVWNIFGKNTSNLGAFPIILVSAGDNAGKILSTSGGKETDYEVGFVAPEAGVYAFKVTVARAWGQSNNDGSFFKVAKNGTVIDSVKKLDTTEAAFVIYATLEANDKLSFLHSSPGDNTSDSAYFTLFTVERYGETVTGGDDNDNDDDNVGGGDNVGGNEGGNEGTVNPSTSDGILLALAAFITLSIALVIKKR